MPANKNFFNKKIFTVTKKFLNKKGITMGYELYRACDATSLIIYSQQELIELIKRGEINNATVRVNLGGQEYIRSKYCNFPVSIIN